ncbi:MAG TPA: nitrogen regulation protein NR(II) [Pusillimonas sp.]|uniref:nitrogen regulation protein NR(II) n=1 Tax=Pusillimonas sp. TaxID=3040095 RepID=UPI002CCEC660|nr:nitrogen regulation protein NR(II) [Pusillimonas sp.]HUH87504.1 nitrogen regulation protein NR(II) [Pusillimonas sp.]
MDDISHYDLLATAILALDSQGNVIEANVAAQELFGQSQRQLVGLSALSLFSTDEALAARFADAVCGRYGVLRLTTAAKGPAGEFASSLTVAPVDHDKWSALLEVRSLDHQGAPDRTQQLSKELQVQRESLRNLAHEVKNPLGGIRGAAQLLEAELGAGPLREYTSVIVSEADRLRVLIDRLIAPQGDSLRMQRFNVHEICERVHTLLKAEFSPPIEVLRDYDASLPELDGDRERLLQALLNVARNGAQALLEQGSADKPTLTLRTRIGRQLVLASRPVRMGVVVSVIDNGPGIADALRDKVFHPLVTGRASGTGLGLSLAQEFVQQHGGIIEFDSCVGHTEFRLILPLEPS